MRSSRYLLSIGEGPWNFLQHLHSSLLHSHICMLGFLIPLSIRCGWWISDLFSWLIQVGSFPWLDWLHCGLVDAAFLKSLLLFPFSKVPVTPNRTTAFCVATSPGAWNIKISSTSHIHYGIQSVFSDIAVLQTALQLHPRQQHSAKTSNRLSSSAFVFSLI